MTKVTIPNDSQDTVVKITIKTACDFSRGSYKHNKKNTPITQPFELNLGKKNSGKTDVWTIPLDNTMNEEQAYEITVEWFQDEHKLSQDWKRNGTVAAGHTSNPHPGGSARFI